MDSISDQSKYLGALRTVSHQSLKVDKNLSVFLRGYGGSYCYASNLSALECGYRDELDHNAIEVGTLLKNVDSVYGNISFGLWGHMGNYFYNLWILTKAKKVYLINGSLQHMEACSMTRVFI
ncbi:hypothetical protein [Bartonella sp. B39]